MLYIQHSACISAQSGALEEIPLMPALSEQNKLKAVEPKYEGIPNNLLRRMGRTTRMSIGTAMACLAKAGRLDGIVIGTANGGMEDCIKFMEQIVKYHETDLTPGNFVQSTPNGIAAQIALMKQNRGYNITHAHRGLSFENALQDCMLLLEENPDHAYLLGGVDEISTYNYNVDFLDGWNKKEEVSSTDLYTSKTPGSIAGEGSAMFVTSADKTNALAAVRAVDTIHTRDSEVLKNRLLEFLTEQNIKPDLLLSGENGDVRFLHFYEEVEKITDCPVARFKHLSGEYGTASAQALWMSIHLLKNNSFPGHMLKTKAPSGALSNILIYNNYKGTQHSFMLVSKVTA